MCYGSLDYRISVFLNPTRQVAMFEERPYTSRSCKKYLIDLAVINDQSKSNGFQIRYEVK